VFVSWHVDTYPFYPGTNFQDALSWHDVNTTDDATSNSVQQPFNRPVLFVHTTSMQSADAIVSAYENEAGVDRQSVSVHQMNSDDIRLLDRAAGWEVSQPDLLGSINRVTLPQATFQDEYEAFIEMTYPIRLYIANDDKAGDTLLSFLSLSCAVERQVASVAVPASQRRRSCWRMLY
jgi:hypothetical protein